MNINDYKNVSVSHGTLKTEDLIKSFISTLEDLNSMNDEIRVEHTLFKLSQLIDRDEIEITVAQNLAYTLGFNGLIDKDYEENATLDFLYDKLNNIAPDGFYFGSHPGDGSDFGFWEYKPE